MSHGWNLRYTSHLGYISPDQPLFRESVASADPWDHVAFAASQGFAGILYPMAVARPAQEVARVTAALRHFQMRSSCIVYAPLDAMLAPSWVRPDARPVIDSFLDRSIPLAQELGAPMLAVLIKAEAGESLRVQEEAAIGLLRHAGDRAAKAGLTIGIEHMAIFPDMLLTSTAHATALLDRVDHPAVRMIFDTGHIHTLDGDILEAYRLASRHIGLLQLADMPGRVEPGAGVIDFTALLVEHSRSDRAGTPIDLEHGWSRPSLASERAGIEEMRRIDSSLGNRERG